MVLRGILFERGNGGMEEWENGRNGEIRK